MKKLILILMLLSFLDLICKENKSDFADIRIANDLIVLIKTNGSKMISTNGGYSWVLKEKLLMTVVTTKVNGEKLITTNSGYTWKKFVELNYNNSNTTFTIDKNPVINDCKFNVYYPKEGKYELNIFDVLGNSVITSTYSLSNSYNEIPLNLSMLINGRYFVVLNDGINIYHLSFIKI